MGAAAVRELARAAVLLAVLSGGAQAQVHSGAEPDTLLADHAVDAAPAITDAWLGSDKFQHVGLSYATSAFAFAAAAAAGRDADSALMIALPVGAVAGIGKELLDLRRGGLFSMKDLVADALGLAAAYFLLREVQ